MKNFRTLNIALEFYRQIACQKVPSPIKNQLERAAVSIGANLAEGSGRHSVRDCRRFYQIAFSSLRESQALLLLAGLEDSEVFQLSDKLAAHLYKLIQATG